MIDLNTLSLDGLWEATCLTPGRTLVRMALEEDGAFQDITTAACQRAGERRAAVVLRQPGIVAGLRLGELVAGHFPGLALSCAPGVRDGQRAAAGRELLLLRGPVAALLPVERTLLNLLGIAVATATATASFVDAVAGTRAVICDTRKTIPTLRWLQKYAVRCGGGHLHRAGLDDAVLLKDNHLAALGPEALAECVARSAARARATGRLLRFVCAEVDDAAQLRALLRLPAGTIDIALLDNFAPAALVEAVALRNEFQPALQLEASGGVRRETVAAIAATGVDRISVGAITHSCGWADVAMDMLE